MFLAEFEDGVIVLPPKQLVDASQAYFWRDKGQKAER
ncbi:hypothetical protein BH18CHL2_BH18CHL2_10740 [soil metagenome]